MSNPRRSEVNLNDLLDSCIEVESLKINKRVTIPKQVCFRLNKKTITAIEHFKANNRQFKLSQPNLATLRCYALFNLPFEHKFNKSRQSYLSQSSLIFSSQYTEDKFDSDTLLRSTVDPEGKILQQIKQELLQNPLLLERVSEAHYWLTTQILTQIPFEPKHWRYGLIYGCLTLAIFAICILILCLVTQNAVIKLTICLFLIGLFIAIALSKHLKSWAIHQLLAAIFSQKTFGRKLSLTILNFLI